MALPGTEQIGEKGALQRQVEEIVRDPAVIPKQGHAFYAERASDPPAPAKGVLVYCIADNGAGKRAIRARFPTGAVQVLATEP